MDDGHVYWGAVTVALMFNPILLHRWIERFTLFELKRFFLHFFLSSATLVFDICKAKWKGSTPVNMKSEMKKLVTHIPFFLPLR